MPNLASITHELSTKNEHHIKLLVCEAGQGSEPETRGHFRLL